jgi:hypothetical protein
MGGFFEKYFMAMVVVFAFGLIIWAFFKSNKSNKDGCGTCDCNGAMHGAALSTSAISPTLTPVVTAAAHATKPKTKPKRPPRPKPVSTRMAPPMPQRRGERVDDDKETDE